MQADGFLIAFVQEVEGGVMVGWLATPFKKTSTKFKHS